MRPIIIKNLPTVYDSINGQGAFAIWEREANSHMDKLKRLSHSARKKYLNRHNHWSKLYAALSHLSHGKCWYSESPSNANEWEIDHFRPKLKSKAEDGTVIRGDGYWWLAYYWQNFRLAGTLINKVRRDRFQIDGKPYGKGNFFPLTISNGHTIAEPYDTHCACESILLLDPIVPRDTKYISFDENGDAIENADGTNDPRNFKRAQLSIYFYGLNHTPLTKARRQIWEACKNEIEVAHNYYKNKNVPNNLRELYIEQCFTRLFEMSRDDQPYSSVVFAYIRFKKNDYVWLEDLLEVISK